MERFYKFLLSMCCLPLFFMIWLLIGILFVSIPLIVLINPKMLTINSTKTWGFKNEK